MEHGSNWLDLLPGYSNLQSWVAENMPSTFFNHTPVLLQHVMGAFLVLLAICGISLYYKYGMTEEERIIPKRRISLMGVIVLLMEMVYNQCRDLMGSTNAAKHFPFIVSVGLFILFSNLLGLIPGFTPPTDNWNTTLAAAIYVFIYYNFWAFKVQGWHYIEHTANPVGTWWGWFMAPFFLFTETISHIARPFSLSVRLMANMMGDHKVVGVFVALFAPLMPIPIILLGMMTTVIQAVVFTLLAMVYVKMAVEEEA